MRTSRILVTAAALVLLGAVSAANAMGPLRPSKELRDLAITAVSEDAAAAKEARAKLRAAGPEGMAAMEFQFRPEIRKALNGTQPAGDAAWGRIRAALDAVAAQRDAHASGLYWYTDLEKAKAAARESGMPILSLRLLGTLDSELSCANSRFFRTALYANREVAAFLESRFVLHWQSVRPVPRVTIDMGDGRVIYRTITGNSIHYVLDADGRPVDAVPGLYGPAAFMRTANAALEVEQKLRGLNSADRGSALSLWHAERVRAIDSEWQKDLNGLGIYAATVPAFPPSAVAPPVGPVSARIAVETAVPKAAAAERTIVREVVPADDAAIRAEADALLAAAQAEVRAADINVVVGRCRAAAPVAAKRAIGKYAIEARIVDEVVAAPAPVAPVAQPARPPVAPPANQAAKLAIGKRKAEVRIVDEVVGAPAEPAPVPVATPPANAAAKVAVGKRQAEVRIVNEVVGAPAEPQQVPAAVAPAPAPAANVAAPRARGKSLVEARIVNEVVGVPATATPAVDLAGATTPDVWLKIAALHAADAKLDEGSRRLMRSKVPSAKVAAALTATKADVEDPIVRTIANFERSVAEDTVRNEYTFHRQIHVWFGQQQPETMNVDQLNARVYSELFLTPDSDPWLGLIPADTYSALQDDGMSEACLK